MTVGSMLNLGACQLLPQNRYTKSTALKGKKKPAAIFTNCALLEQVISEDRTQRIIHFHLENAS